MIWLAAYTLIAIFSVEGIFFGINCVLYAFCVYTLWGQKAISCRLLLLMNTVQFLLCATQYILHAIFYFVMFTVHIGDIGPYLQHVNAYILGSVVIFNLSFIAAGFLSIWRLYILYDNYIWVCIPAFVIWIAQICMSAKTIHISATTPVASTAFSPFNMSLWALITALNLCVSIPICSHIYFSQKKTRAILSPNPLKSTAFLLVECSALITACSIAMTILYATYYPYAYVSIGIATEVAVVSQLLITARHGLLGQRRPTACPQSSSGSACGPSPEPLINQRFPSESDLLVHLPSQTRRTKRKGSPSDNT